MRKGSLPSGRLESTVLLLDVTPWVPLSFPIPSCSLFCPTSPKRPYSYICEATNWPVVAKMALAAFFLYIGPADLKEGVSTMLWLPQFGLMTSQSKSWNFGIWFSYSPTFLDELESFWVPPKTPSPSPWSCYCLASQKNPRPIPSYPRTSTTLRLVPSAQSTETGLKRTELTEQGDTGVQQLGMGTD